MGGGRRTVINNAGYIHFCRLKNPSMAIAIATITPSTSG
jgi:hypothetical protein